MQDKTTWTTNTKHKGDAYDQELRLANQELQQGCTNRAAEAVNSKTDLTYNPEKLKIITRFILNMNELQEVKADMLDMSVKAIKAKYTETYVRNVLSLECLLTTAGKRPSTVANMKKKELQKAQRLEDGSHIVLVHEHKTAPTGPSQLSFIRDGLYEACKKYAEVFKAGMSEERPVFSTFSGKAHNLRWSVNWVKPLIPPSVASKEELKTLTAKSFRKGFSNWGAEHPDPVVNRDTIEAQDHSERVDKLNYHVKAGRRVNAVNKIIMTGVMEPDEVEGDEDPGDTSASQESSEGSSSGKRFSKGKRDYMRMALGTRRTDGSIRPPLKCPKNQDIKAARVKFPHFGDIYDDIIKSTGFTPSKVNNLIWTSVRLTTKQKKPASSVRPAPEKKQKESDSSDESDESDSDQESNASDSDSDSSEYSYNIGQRRGSKRKASDNVFKVGKKARKVKTPGTQ